jgi:hypothetical protein
MSVVTTLSVVLFVGLIATGLVGFLGWRQRMREAQLSANINHRPSQDQHADTLAKGEQYNLEGKCL